MKIRAILYVLATTVILAACLAPTAIQAQNCIDYSAYLGWRARVAPLIGEYSPQTLGVTVVGDLTYVGSSSAGLAIYNVIDPVNPVLLGVADTPGICLNMLVEGNYAYVADWHSPGFCVVDVTNPAAPVVVGTAGGGATPFFIDVAMVKPDTVYVLDRYYGVRMFDVSDRTNPDMYGGIEILNSPWGLDVDGVYLYVTNQFDGLYVFDVTVAAGPDLREFLALPGPGFSIDVVGDFAYVACGESGLQIIDVSDPENPHIAGNLGITDPFTLFFNVHVVGNLAYLLQDGAGHSHGLVIVNVANPTAPYLVNSLAATPQNESHDLFVAGDYAYVGAVEKGLLVADVSNTASPVFTSSYVEEDFFPKAVAASGDYAYVLDGYFGLRVMDITTIPHPILLGTVDLPGASSEVVLDGGLAYVADDSGGLQIVDVTDPSAPEIIGSIMPVGNQIDVDVQGTYAYLASPNWGLQIIDVSDPTTPVQRGTVNPPGSTRGLAVDGDHAYLACQYSGLQVADITNPDAPSVIGELDFDGWPVDVHLARGHAFVSAMEYGVYIVDITNPAAPELVSTLVTPSNAWRVIVEGNLAYIADVQGGLQIADITDLADPRYLGCVDTPNHTAYGLALAGDRICIADWEGGFHVIWKQCVASAVPEGEVPTSPLVMKAYPNPFNPETTISFTLEQSEATLITVFTLDGRPVRLLADRVFSVGKNTASWNGLDDSGRRLPSGSYLIRLQTATGVQQSKVTLLK